MLWTAFALAAGSVPSLRPELAPFEFLVGHCWSATVADKAVDTHCFTAMFGGQHVRDVHIVRGPGGEYRGETIYSWDPGRNTVRYSYYNSLGSVLEGTMVASAGGLNFTPGVGGPVVWRKHADDGYDVVAGGRTLRFRRLS